jgi:serine/threonine protein kinase
MDKLGKGAFGDAFVAQEKVTGFMCVIKKLSNKRLIEHKLQ